LWLRRLDEIIVFRQLSKSEVKEIADIMLREVFHRAEIKGIKIDVTERFKVRRVQCYVTSLLLLLHECSFFFCVILAPHWALVGEILSGRSRPRGGIVSVATEGHLG